MSDTTDIDDLLKSTTDEQKAHLLAALADDLEVEIKPEAESGLDALGKALSTGPGISTSGGSDANEAPDSLDDVAKAFGGGN